MLIQNAHSDDSHAVAVLSAVETAARAIPPAFPLDATVAVNPFLGQSHEDIATASARLERVAGIRLARERRAYRAQIESGMIGSADLADALAASPCALKPENLAQLEQALATNSPVPKALPTVAELAASESGTDWPEVIKRSVGLWAAGHFDRGQALWSPAPGRTALDAWRDWARHDLTPEIAGLAGFCSHAVDAPDTVERAILRASESLGITEANAQTVFHRLLIDLGGWAQHARWLLWEAELAGETDTTIAELLAIRLIWEEALLAQYPQLAPSWEETCAAHEKPVAPTREQVIDAILQDAAERAHQRRVEDMLPGARPRQGRPAMQAAFCIDVRSEVFRRSLESLDTDIATIGFAGFFGLPVSHSAHGSDTREAHLPVLLKPGLRACSHADEAGERDVRIRARARRAWGRFRQAAVSSFAFIEAAGPVYGWKLIKDTLARGGGIGRQAMLESSGKGARKVSANPPPRFEEDLTAQTKAATGAAVLKAMSMTEGHARLVLLIGHGAHVTNNPHESAYHCGACAGQTGEVSARLLAGLLNDPETRAGLPGHGIDLPEDTVFVAGLHDTTTDKVTLFEDTSAPTHSADLEQARNWLAQAGDLARAERAARLPGADATSIAQRAFNWAEVRPEWGLAGCAAFIAAPRAATSGTDLQGRSFLHSYDWRTDTDFKTLELILTAPVVVASWISLQYYGSSVAPDVFGSGNKLIHNVVGGIGVVQGNGGMLRPGLPWQAVHDGESFAHEPLRLSVYVEAPQEAISEILARHDEVRALFDNGWLHLFTLKGGRVAARYRPGLAWENDSPCSIAA